MPTQKISIPVSRNEVSVTVTPGQTLEFADDLSNARFMRPDPSENGKNPDLHVTFDDGGTLVLKNFFAASEEGGQGLPTLKLADGTEVAGSDFLRAFDPAFDLDTAAGPAAQADSGGLNEAASAPDMAIGGVETLGSLGTSHWSTSAGDGGSGEGFTATTLAAAGLPGGGDDAGNPGAGGDGGNTGGGGGGNEEQEKDRSDYRAIIRTEREDAGQGEAEGSLTSIEVPLSVNGVALTAEEIEDLLEANDWGLFCKDADGRTVSLLTTGAFSFEVTEGSIIFTPNYDDHSLEGILEDGVTASIPNPLGGGNWSIPVQYEDDGSSLHLSGTGSRDKPDDGPENNYISAGGHTDIHVNAGGFEVRSYVAVPTDNAASMSAADGGTITITDASGVYAHVYLDHSDGTLRGLEAAGKGSAITITTGLMHAHADASEGAAAADAIAALDGGRIDAVVNADFTDISAYTETGTARGMVAEDAGSEITITTESMGLQAHAHGAGEVAGMAAGNGGKISVTAREEISFDIGSQGGNAAAALVEGGSSLSLSGSSLFTYVESSGDSQGIAVSDKSTLNLDFTDFIDLGVDGPAADAGGGNARGLSLDGASTATVTTGGGFDVTVRNDNGGASVVEVTNNSVLEASVGENVHFEAETWSGSDASALTVQGESRVEIQMDGEYGSVDLRASSYSGDEETTGGQAKALEVTDKSSVSLSNAGFIDLYAKSDNGDAAAALVESGSSFSLSGHKLESTVTSSGESQGIIVSENSALDLTFTEGVGLDVTSNTYEGEAGSATGLSLDKSSATINAGGGEFVVEAESCIGSASAVEAKNGSVLTVQTREQVTMDARVLETGDAAAALVEGESSFSLSGSRLKSDVASSGDSQGIIVSDNSTLGLTFTEGVNLDVASNTYEGEAGSATGLSVTGSSTAKDIVIGEEFSVHATTYHDGNTTAVEVKDNSELDGSFNWLMDFNATSYGGGKALALSVQNKSHVEFATTGEEESAHVELSASSYGVYNDETPPSQAKALEVTDESSVILTATHVSLDASIENGDSYLMDVQNTSGVEIHSRDSIDMELNNYGSSNGAAYIINAVSGSVDLSTTEEYSGINASIYSSGSGRTAFLNAEDSSAVTIVAGGEESHIDVSINRQGRQDNDDSSVVSLVDAVNLSTVTMRADHVKFVASSEGTADLTGLTAKEGSSIGLTANKSFSLSVTAGNDDVPELPETWRRADAHGAAAFGDSTITITAGGDLDFLVYTNVQASEAYGLSARQDSTVTVTVAGATNIQASGEEVDASSYALYADGQSEMTLAGSGSMWLSGWSSGDGSGRDGAALWADNDSTITVTGSDEIYLSGGGGAGYGYGMYAGEGSTNTVNSLVHTPDSDSPGETYGVTIEITATSDIIEQAYAMYADGPGAQNIVNGTDLADRIYISGNVAAENGGRNEINAGDGDDVIIFNRGANFGGPYSVGVDDLHLDAGDGYDTLVLFVRDFDDFQTGFSEWLENGFTGMSVEAIHVYSTAGINGFDADANLAAFQSYFEANSGLFGGTSVTFGTRTSLFDNASSLNLDAFDGESALSEYLEALDVNLVSKISLEGAKDSTLTIDDWHHSMKNGLTIDGGANDTVILGDGWTPGENNGSYTTYSDGNNHSIQIDNEITIQQLLNEIGG